MSEQEAIREVVRQARIAELSLPRSIHKHKGLRPLWQELLDLDELKYGKAWREEQQRRDDAFDAGVYV